MEGFLPGNIVGFLDKKLKVGPDGTGCNNVGIIIDPDKVYFYRHRRFCEMSIKEFEKIEKAFIVSTKNKSVVPKLTELIKRITICLNLGCAR